MLCFKIWVVDSSDVNRLHDCKEELKRLLQEEVCHFLFTLLRILMLFAFALFLFVIFLQKLAGASLLVFANKQDLQNAKSLDEIRDVSYNFFIVCKLAHAIDTNLLVLINSTN